jgi:hypothetical protein
MDCPFCGYDLSGIAIDHCPECGAKLDLRAVMLFHESARQRLEERAESRQSWIILLVVLLFLGLPITPLICWVLF